ncbi:hypothetical protein FRC18_002676 [Serendipita sp. 400]|nr:hypothetical protein FRC18_002676 [Serendipita sp. 400]
MSTSHKQKGIIGTAVQGVRRRLSSLTNSQRPDIVPSPSQASTPAQTPTIKTRPRTLSLTSLRSFTSQHTGSTRHQPTPGPSLDSDISRLRSQFEQLKAKQTGTKRTITALKQENNQLTSDNSRLEREIKQAEREKRTVDQDLAASLSHAPTEGIMSAQDALMEFKTTMEDIEPRIKEMLKLVYPILKDMDLPLKSYGRHLKGLRSQCPVSFISTLASYYKQMPAVSIVFPIIRHLLMYHIQVAVFEGWTPGVASQPDEKLLRKLHHTVRGNEPQDQSARWRALTYTHTSGYRDTYYWDNYASDLSNELARVLQPLTHPKPLNPNIFSLFRKHTRSILERVARFRDTVMKNCTEAEPIVHLFLYSNRFQQALMQPVMCIRPTKGVPQHCILAVSFALQLAKNVPSEKGGYRLAHIGAVPANVITELPYDHSAVI